MNLTEKEKEYYIELQFIRQYLSNALKLSAAMGVEESVVEKYSDQAHFIYELLQNASDVEAEYVKFLLYKGGLYVYHNGKVPFNITQPDTLEDKEIEKRDSLNGTLGHVNAICSIGNTSKKNKPNSIGKFGVGFKSVFQYTKTPHIYDKKIHFKITDFIIPELLKEDIKDRNDTETVFYFPFDNNEEMQPERAFDDITKKLKNLNYPILFINNVKKIDWVIQNDNIEENGSYLKEIKKLDEKDCLLKDSLLFDEVILCQQINKVSINEKLLVFNRYIKDLNLNCSIGFFIDEKTGMLRPNEVPAYCFFPTIENTKLNFVIHAPFLLTDGRESIKKEHPHNIKMIEDLSTLAADSLLILRDMKLIDDNIFDIIPYIKPLENDLFKDFYYKIKEKFQTEELFPANDGTYVKKENAYWASVPKITALFSNKQLSYLLANNENEENDKWVFTSKGRDETLRINKELANYIDDIISNWFNEDDILNGFTFDDGSKFNGITSQFIEKQSDEWLYLFYKWISETEGRRKLAKGKPFFLNKEREAVPSIDVNEKSILFLPSNDNFDYETLNHDLFYKTTEIISKNENLLAEDLAKSKELTKKFFERFNIREYTVADEINDAINNFQNQKIEPENFFDITFKYFKDECPQNEIDDFIEKITRLPFIPYYNTTENGYASGKLLFYPTEKLIEFYTPKPDTKFVDIILLQKRINQQDFKTLDLFLKKINVNDKEPVLKDEIFNIILPKYNTSIKKTIEECCKDFTKIFKYFLECPNNEINSYLSKIKVTTVFLSKYYNETTELSNKLYLNTPNNLYYPNSELLKYFDTKPNTLFIDLEDYYKYITDKDEQDKLHDFLIKLGVSELPKILENEIKNHDIKKELNLTRSTYGYDDRNTTIDKILDGCEEIIEEIIKNKDKKKSILLWSYLVKLQYKVRNRYDWENRDIYFLDVELKGKHSYFRYSQFSQEFDSKTLRMLKNEKWLLTKNNKFVAPHDITINDLDDSYEISSELEKLLMFRESEQKVNDLVSTLLELGIEIENPEDTTQQLKEFFALDREKRIEFLEKNKKNVIDKNEKIIKLNELEDNINEDKANRIKNKLIEKIKNAPLRTTEERTRNVDISINITPFVYNYLKERYEIEEQGVVCQICLDSMPFRYKDEDFFEKVEFLSINKKHNFNYLCLCPNCSQLFRNMKKEVDFKVYLFNKISKIDIQKNNLSIIDINDFNYKKINTDKSKKIHFTQNHLHAIKTITEAEIVLKEDEEEEN